MPVLVKPGTRLYGAACSTEMIVVRAPSEPVDLRIGGHGALLDVNERSPGRHVTTPPDRAALVGKRYVDASGAVELLCTKSGDGAPALGDVLFELVTAKALPASD